MANKFRGEIAVPVLGNGAYLRFSLDDLAELVGLFGRDFFGVVENAAAFADALDLQKVLAIGLKRRDGDKPVRIWGEIDKDRLQDEGFSLDQVTKQILDALAYAQLQKSYAELVEEAEALRKKREDQAEEELREVAEKEGIPFETMKVLFGVFSRLQTGPA